MLNIDSDALKPYNYIFQMFKRQKNSDSDLNNIFNINMYIYIVQQKYYS